MREQTKRINQLNVVLLEEAISSMETKGKEKLNVKSLAKGLTPGKHHRLSFLNL